MLNKKNRKISGIVLSLSVVIALSGCGSDSTDLDIPVVKNSSIQVERGPIVGGILTDATGQVAIPYNNISGKYIFPNEIVYPISMEGGYIDLNNNNKVDEGEPLLDMELKTDKGNIITLLTTANLDPELSSIVKELFPNSSIYSKLPTEDNEILAFSNSYFNLFYEKGLLEKDILEFSKTELLNLKKELRKNYLLKKEEYKNVKTKAKRLDIERIELSKIKNHLKLASKQNRLDYIAAKNNINQLMQDMKEAKKARYSELFNIQLSESESIKILDTIFGYLMEEDKEPLVKMYFAGDIDSVAENIAYSIDPTDLKELLNINYLSLEKFKAYRAAIKSMIINNENIINSYIVNLNINPIEGGEDIIKEPLVKNKEAFYWLNKSVNNVSDYPLLSFDYNIIGIDLFDTQVSEIQDLHAKGIEVFCYFSAGSFEDWRPDMDKFPESAIGNKLDGWDGENWLDIRDTQVLNIMKERINLAAQKGCDAVDYDNVDGYTNVTGFDLTKADQERFLIAMATYSKALGLKTVLKNGLLMIDNIEPYFDYAVNESCHHYKECYYYDNFIENNKFVFNIEYDINNMKNQEEIDLSPFFKSYIANSALDGTQFDKF